MTRQRRRPAYPILFVLCVFVWFCLAGCGAKQNGPVLAATRGSVVYRGQPLVGAQVVFASESGTRASFSTTDTYGRFRLGTFRPGDGAVVGKQSVTIVAEGPRRPPPPGTLGAGMPGGPSLPGLPLIPQKYFHPKTSGLNADVRAGTENVFDIVLED